MTEDAGPNRQDNYRECCPWLMLTRSFTFATSIQVLMLAALGALGTAAGWRISERWMLPDRDLDVTTQLGRDVAYLGAWPAARNAPVCPLSDVAGSVGRAIRPRTRSFRSPTESCSRPSKRSIVGSHGASLVIMCSAASGRCWCGRLWGVRSRGSQACGLVVTNGSRSSRLWLTVERSAQRTWRHSMAATAACVNCYMLEPSPTAETTCVRVTCRGSSSPRPAFQPVIRLPPLRTGFSPGKAEYVMGFSCVPESTGVSTNGLERKCVPSRK